MQLSMRPVLWLLGLSMRLPVRRPPAELKASSVKSVSRLDPARMAGRHDIELLWFSDCPNHKTARALPSRGRRRDLARIHDP